LNPADLSKQMDEENIKVTKSDFLLALDEVKPAFGAAINTLEMCRYVSSCPVFLGSSFLSEWVFLSTTSKDLKSS
jgi:hypothetical protein